MPCNIKIHVAFESRQKRNDVVAITALTIFFCKRVPSWGAVSTLTARALAIVPGAMHVKVHDVARTGIV